MSKPILAWINCYGAWAPDLREPVETVGYNAYLNGVADAIAGLNGWVQAAVASGGMKDAAGRTECATTIPELKRRLAHRGFPNLPIEADEESLTSISVMRTFLQTWNEHYSDYHPIVFTDVARLETNRYALEYFSQKLNIPLPPLENVLIPLPRLDNHPDSSREKQAPKLQAMREKGVEAVEKEQLATRQP